MSKEFSLQTIGKVQTIDKVQISKAITDKNLSLQPSNKSLDGMYLIWSPY